MSKREEIIEQADSLIREKGYNAFSYYDISEKIQIKNASIHYHFPIKSDLGIAVIERHINNLNNLIELCKHKTSIEKLEHFFEIYAKIKRENKVCIVGSLATDFNTLELRVQEKLKEFSEKMLNWVSTFLEEGRNENSFIFDMKPRTKALLIISNMLAIVQISRLTNDNDFTIIKETIKKELVNK